MTLDDAAAALVVAYGEDEDPFGLFLAAGGGLGQVLPFALGGSSGSVSGCSMLAANANGVSFPARSHHHLADVSPLPPLRSWAVSSGDDGPPPPSVTPGTVEGRRPRVGPAYQAAIPWWPPARDEAAEDQEMLLWDPVQGAGPHVEAMIETYCCRDALRGADDACVSLQTFMDLVHESGYDHDNLRRLLANRGVVGWSADTIQDRTPWNDTEAEDFNLYFRALSGDLNRLQKVIISKRLAHCVEYYYLGGYASEDASPSDDGDRAVTQRGDSDDDGASSLSEPREFESRRSKRRRKPVDDSPEEPQPTRHREDVAAVIPAASTKEEAQMHDGSEVVCR